MKTDIAIGILILVATGTVAGIEVGFIQGQFAALILVAGLVTSLMFSVINNKLEAAMANGDTVELEGEYGGVKGRMRFLSDKAVILLLLCSLAFFGYKHHTMDEEKLDKLMEAMAENTYVLSLSQADREKLNISMPEGLRRKIRAREQ